MKDKQPIEVTCECGCGEKFAPNRKWHKYFSPKCRLDAFLRRKANSDLEKRIEAIEKQVGIQ